MSHWLLKSESDCYSINDLKKDGKAVPWTGIRNYQARNFMKAMEVGDTCLFYHSGGTKEEPTGVYGVAKVTVKAHADETQFDKKSEYFEPKASKEKPIWECVDVAYQSTFSEPVTLIDIKRDPKLTGIAVAQQGSRLSVQPVSPKHFEHIVKLGK